jgi:hypothetical protein
MDLSSYWRWVTVQAIIAIPAAARWPISEATTYRALSSHWHGIGSTSHATNTECQDVVVTGACVRRMRLLLDRESIGPKSKMGCIKIARHAILAPCRRLVESYTGDSSLSRAAGPTNPSFASAANDPIPPNFSAITSCASLPHHVAWSQPAKQALAECVRYMTCNSASANGHIGSRSASPS